MFSHHRVLKTFVLTAVAAPALWGCSNYVTREEYDRNVNALQQANDSLKRRNLELEAQGAECEAAIAKARLYENISEDLRKILEGIGGSDGLRRLGPGHWELTDDAFFASGSDNIKAQFKQQIVKLADSLKNRDNVYVRFVGHTDSDPIQKSKNENPTGMNLELGTHRAIAVADVFKDAGFPELRMYVESAGASQPKASNSTKEGKKQNRRVDIYIGEGTPLPVGDSQKRRKDDRGDKIK